MPIALAAVPVDVVISLAVLLFLYAFRAVIVKAFAWILGEIPVVGGNLAERLNAGADIVVGWAESWAKWGINAMVQIIAVPVGWLGAIVGGVVNLAEGIVANLATLFGLAAAGLDRLISTASLLAGQVVTVAAHLAALAASIAGSIASIASALIARAVELVRAEVASVLALAEAGIARVAALVGSVEAALAARIAAAVAGLTASLAAAVGALQLQLGHDVQAIDGELAKLTAGVGQLAGLLPLIGVVPIVLELTDIAEECIIPNCKVQGPQLGVLQDLMAMATLLAVGELVGEAVRNPAGAAGEVAAIAGDVEGAARDLFGAFAGVTL
jgi:hypothetical protein